MNSDKRLAPGFGQVDAFDSDERYDRDEDGEVIEEISYVTLDLGAVEPTLVPSSSTYRLIGLDTPTPFLQLSGAIFQGTHQSVLGTELLFTEDKDVHDQTRRKVSHLADTSQRIRFKQVEVRPKDVPPEDLPGPSTHGKSKSVKKKSSTVDDDQIVDQITGNVEPGDVPLQRRRGGKGKGKRGSGSEPSQSQPGQGHIEQAAAPEEPPSSPGVAMEP